MPTVDFDKIFSTNASSTPFTWSDSDYLVGWDSIENTPPSRQQFNALHMISDLKDHELNNVKAPKHSPVFTGDPQAPTPAWNDGDTSIATTAFVKHWIDEVIDQIGDNGVGITESLVDLNGYVVFKNGFIIQWAIATTDSSGIGTGSFAIDFPNGVRGVYVTGDEATIADWHKLQHAASTSNSDWEVTSFDVLTSTPVNGDGMWIMAIGY